MSLKSEWRRMRSDIRSAYKSEDTEEFFDRIFTKPLGYLWARLFMRLGWTPNMVTLLSMAIGFAGGWLFYPESFTLNLIHRRPARAADGQQVHAGAHSGRAVHRRVVCGD